MYGVYIYVERESEREREKSCRKLKVAILTFWSQNFTFKF